MTRARRIACLLMSTLWFGCSSGNKGSTGTPDMTPPVMLTESQVDANRAACAFTPNQLTADTMPVGTLTGSKLPIDHIILIMQENRSFDHYFSELPIAGLNVASRDITNPDSMGNLVQRFHFTTKCMGGGDHGWVAEHGNLDNGALDGFVRDNGDSHTPMGYYDATDLPYYYALAQTFAFSDSHFSSTLAPTWPNRMFYFAGTSYGYTDNEFPPSTDPSGKTYPTLFNQLDANKIDWHVYAQDTPTPDIVAISEAVNEPEHFLDTANFASDVAAGNLAPVTVVEGSDVKGAASPDEGPPSDVDVGQNFTSGVISTIMNSPFWKSSVIFLSYDENGGMYDHVVPPAACPPDDIAVRDGGGATFNQYGFRVPFFVISPYAKRGYVSHVVTDHTSILRFVESRFDIPSMSKRDANAAPAYDMFDFDNPDFSVPTLPTVTIDQAALTACLGN
jgi:phospholipase C